MLQGVTRLKMQKVCDSWKKFTVTLAATDLKLQAVPTCTGNANIALARKQSVVGPCRLVKTLGHDRAGAMASAE